MSLGLECECSVDLIFQPTGMLPCDAFRTVPSLVVPDLLDRPWTDYREAGAVVVHGDSALGQVAATFANRAAFERARVTKATFVAVRVSHRDWALRFGIATALD